MRTLLISLCCCLLFAGAVSTAHATNKPADKPSANDVVEPTYTFRYAVAFSGVERNPAFAQFVDDTLNDHRGWSLGGEVRFVRDQQHPQFTVNLATPSRMHRFGCHTVKYSCRSKNNVTINHRRWTYGVDGFHGDRYRHMLVQHEIGHWLGFGHANDYCHKVKGRQAPVMMQQSGGRRGCRANPWPLAAEQQLLSRRLGTGWRPSAKPGTATIPPARHIQRTMSPTAHIVAINSDYFGSLLS